MYLLIKAEVDLVVKNTNRAVVQWLVLVTSQQKRLGSTLTQCQTSNYLYSG